MIRRFSLSLAMLGFATALVLAPVEANACGGIFSDGGDLNQSDENVLFWIDHSGSEPHIEAHIQIKYEGDPERFAWVIPVSQVPEVLVGSQALFDNLLAATKVTLTVDVRTEDNCGSALGCGPDIDWGSPGSDGNSDESDDEGPEILERGFAGAFEYTILTADNVDAITDWLDQGNYQQDPDAPPILERYLQEGYVFVALELRGGAGIDEVHPIVLRVPGVEPSIPLRLARIAATPNMDIRAFFLGHARVFPKNWVHVVLNLAKLEWAASPALGYRGRIVGAMNEAGDRGFITEYAGTDEIVSTSGIRNSAWNSAAFDQIDPIDVVEILAEQELLDCSGDSCIYLHPQVLPLLQRYLPAPDNLDEDQFYACLECFESLIDPVAWTAQPGFAVELEQRITAPAQHAIDMLDEASYLTRLFTLISPKEMIEDPRFHENSSLGDVDGGLAATRVLPCDVDGPTYMQIPGGREVVLKSNGAYPTEFTRLADAERIERVPMVGPSRVVVDNTAKIDGFIDAYNQDNLMGPTPPNCSITRLGPEALFGTLMLFGIAWLHRAPRARRRPTRPFFSATRRPAESLARPHEVR